MNPHFWHDHMVLEVRTEWVHDHDDEMKQVCRIGGWKLTPEEAVSLGAWLLNNFGYEMGDK
jgi:hypothetical protein